MIAAFSSADQLRRRPAPVNTSMRRTGSGICLCSEIDMCRSLHRLRDSPFCRHANRWCPNTAYGAIAGRDIHAAAQGYRQMGKVAANTDPFLMPVPSGSRRARVRVAEGYAIVYVVANCLDACPFRRQTTEQRPSGVRKTVGFAIPATQQKLQRLVGQIFYRDLSGIG